MPHGKKGADLQRYERMHELSFHRAYNEFLKGRKYTNETGLLPGELAEDLRDDDEVEAHMTNIEIVMDAPAEADVAIESSATVARGPAPVSPRACCSKALGDAPNEASRAGESDAKAVRRMGYDPRGPWLIGPRITPIDALPEHDPPPCMRVFPY